MGVAGELLCFASLGAFMYCPSELDRRNISTPYFSFVTR
jgi:hypothetical protein